MDGTHLFRNADWTVDANGLEHRETGYFIARATLAARRAERLWDWPMQMAEKRWCRPSLFREAFLVALDCFEVPRDAELTRSFALGYGLRAAEAPAAESFVALGAFVAPREVPRPRAGRERARSLASAAA